MLFRNKSFQKSLKNTLSCELKLLIYKKTIWKCSSDYIYLTKPLFWLTKLVSQKTFYLTYKNLTSMKKIDRIIFRGGEISYTPPAIDVIEITLERGFAQSAYDNWNDGDETMDDNDLGSY